MYPVPTIRVACEAFADKTRSVDDRLKYGEVLSKLVEQCGKDILRPYVHVMVEGLLRMLDLDIAAAAATSKAGDQSMYVTWICALFWYPFLSCLKGRGRRGEAKGGSIV